MIKCKDEKSVYIRCSLSLSLCKGTMRNDKGMQAVTMAKGDDDSIMTVTVTVRVAVIDERRFAY